MNVRAGWIVIGMSLAGCGSAEVIPADLYGMWANEDAGTWRVFDFADSSDEAELAGRSPVFILYAYSDGTEATQVQRGEYDIVTPDLVTTVLWTPDGANVGESFANEIMDLRADTLTLESSSAASGVRVFDRVDTLP